MTDDKTPHNKLPLPHAGNLLSDDVERLRQALTAADLALHTLSQADQTESAARAAGDQKEAQARQALAAALAEQRADDHTAQAAALKKVKILALAGL